MIYLPNVTLIIVDCVDYNRAILSLAQCTKDITFGSIKLLSDLEPQNSFDVKISKINSTTEYSQFILKNLTDYFDTDFVLVAQWDGFVWHSELWEDTFLNYDYIGAPWPSYALQTGIPINYNVGNGGFSIRSKKLQDFLKYDNNLIMHQAEDVVICQFNRKYLEDNGFTFAPEEIAKRFSLEHGDIDPPRFGVHWRLKLEAK